MWPGWEGSSQGFNFKALEKKRGRGRIRDGDALGVGGTGRRFLGTAFWVQEGQKCRRLLYSNLEMLLREGGEKFPAVCTASPFTAANKRVREPWRHAPLRGDSCPAPVLGGKH